MPADLVLECMPALTAAMRDEWTAFLGASRHHHPRQAPDAAAAQLAAGRDVRFVTGRAPDGALRAVGLFALERHRFLRGSHTQAVCLSGPVCDDPAELVGFLEAVATLPAFGRVGQLRVSPFWLGDAAVTLDGMLAAGGWLVAEDEQFRQTGWVDLDRPVEKILGGFSKSARREVRRAERQGVVVRPVADDEGKAAFLDSLNRTHRDRGLAPVAAPVFQADCAHLEPAGEVGTIIGAFHDGAFVAGLLLYRGRFVAHARHFTTEPDRLRALSNLRIAPIVWWHGMLWARERGCVTLDVEGWRTDAAPGDRKYNLYKYKGEFGPTPMLRISERRRTVNRSIDLTGNIVERLRMTAKAFRKGQR